MYRSTQKKARSALYAKKHEVAARISAAVMMFSKSGRVRRGGEKITARQQCMAVGVFAEFSAQNEEQQAPNENQKHITGA